MGKERLIIAGRLIDGTGAALQRNIFLRVVEGRITSMGPATELANKDSLLIDDLSHCTILPPLVDCSVSLSQSSSVDDTVRASNEGSDPSTKIGLFHRHVQDCYVYGVLGVADNGSLTDGYLWEKEKDGSINVKMAITPSLDGSDCHDKNTVQGDFFRIQYSSNIDMDSCTSSGCSYKELHRLLQQTGGNRVVVVANGPQQVEEALAAGCDAVEQGYSMGEKNMRKMADRGVLWIPNILRAKNSVDSSSTSGDVCCRFSQRYAAPGKPIPGAEAFWKLTLENQLKQLRLAKTLGVKTACGTGAGSVGILHGESMVEEMRLFIKAGYSLEETVRCASENGADFFGMQHLSSLTIGQRATFLVTRGTPQQLPRKLSFLEAIYIDGEPSKSYRKNPIIAGS